MFIVSVKHKNWLFLGLIIILGVFLRSYNLGIDYFWYDEVNSILVANETSFTLSFFEKCCQERNPPLFFILVKILKVFGSSEAMLRVLPAFFGILTIIAIYKIGKLIFNDKVALISSLIFSLSPFNVYYSHELRSYTLFTFIATVSVYCFYISLTRNKRWFSYIFFTALCFYTHAFALFLIAAEAIFFISFIRNHRKLLRRWIISQAAIFLFILPWLPIFVRQAVNAGLSGELSQWIPESSLSSFLENLRVFSSGYNAAPDIGSLVILLFGILFLLGLYFSFYKNKYAAVFTFSWFFIPILSAMLISTVVPIYLFRGLIYASVPYYIFVAYGCYSVYQYTAFIFRKALFCLVLIAIGLISCMTLRNFYLNIYPSSDFEFSSGVFPRKNMRGVVNYIKDELQKKDVIVNTCRSSYLPIYYYIGREYRHKLIDKMTPKSYYSAYKNILAVVEMLPDDINRFGFEYDRIWLVNSSWNPKNMEYQLDKGTQDWLNNNCVLIKNKDFEGAQVFLFKVNK